MTTNHHDPYPYGGALTSADMTSPLGQLDAAIDAVILSGSGASTTLTAQANSGQKNMVVASGTNFPNGAVFWIGDPGGTRETGIINTGGGTTTLVALANLANTYAIGKPVSISPVELVDARGTYTTLGGRLTGRFGSILNAKEYGAVGDGTANDTTALQAALDALIAAPTIEGLYIPPGTYKITAALVIGSTAYQYKSIYGAGRVITTIRQDTSNIPVFKTATEDTHSIRFGEMSLDYLVQQTSANTGAIALNFTKATAGIGNGWYYWKIRQLTITKAHIAIGIGGPGATGLLPVWNCEFDGIFTANISMTILRLVSPTVAGMPVNIVRQMTHLTQAVAPAGPAIEIVGAEMRFEGLDVEDWTGRLLYAFGGAPISISGLHVERHHLNSTAAMFEMSNAMLVIIAGSYDFAVEGGVAAKIWHVGAGGSLRVSGARLICTITSGTIVGLSRAASAVSGAVELSGIADDNNNVPLDAVGDFVGTDAVRSAGGVAVVVANRYYFTSFSVKGTRRITTARFEVITQAGGYDIAIYDEYGNLIGDVGYQTLPAAGVQTRVLLTPVLLHPGKKYYAMLVCDNAAAALAYRASASTAYALAAGAASDQAGAVPPAPATVSIAASGGARQYAIDFF